MKKLLAPLFLLLILIVSACGNDNIKTEDNDSKDKGSKTITYQSETGPVKVPSHPKRVVVLSGYTGDVLDLGVNVVGVDTWSKNNPTFKKQLKDVEEVSEDNLEKIIELNPDLIIALSTVKNVDKLKEIAPTVTYTWGKVDYLTQHVEIGKLLNKEKEAKAWTDDFKKRAETVGNDIRAKIGEKSTVSVIEAYGKDLYVYGNNWARGTEILYQTMKLNMPEKVKKDALKAGYYTLSSEVLPEYAGDYVILSKYSDSNTSFQNTDTYKNIPAVKNGHVFEMQGEGASFTDPITLEKQLAFFKKAFLEN
ncbi:iron-hydroxamate ABC transporter substrate-binding protein [Priestia koreensis]|uniref:iron-hydroxamate ABC transporter substrate-binding protein n=1 Tax=Priestia koreensis TaxID=284581 RepID=UPI001F5808ED|nr:iron-hydroxamate ABC transporter substrate-binding protein [Priestia koreensis]UNL87407.1 iron-hydroxamate ABC transporter substrate-binding protein [Priestia koreensis]